MEQNSFTEYCEQCGSPNVCLVERSMLPWHVLAMIPRSLSPLSPVFFSLSVRGNTRRGRQDRQYRCLKCNRTWLR